jgi:plastocyanin
VHLRAWAGTGVQRRRGMVAAGIVVWLAIPGSASKEAPIPRGQTSQTGSITGRVKITARVRGAALPANTYPSRTVTVQEPPRTPELRNVVVYLKDVAYRGTPPAMRRQIRQEHESFVPRVVAITRGSTVDFPNGDAYFHNVFSLSSVAPFDLGRYPEGHSRSEHFMKAGLVKVYCHIHSHMSASILVLDHPYFAIPEDDGTFVLTNVPAGDYRLVAWHERVGEQVARVLVEPGQAASVEIALPVADRP